MSNHSTSDNNGGASDNPLPNGGSDDSHVDEEKLQELADVMQKDLDESVAGGNRSARPTIFRVHPTIRRQDEQAFQPQFVSIGPLHRTSLQSMENEKRSYLQDLIRRTPTDGQPEPKLKAYIRAMMMREKTARDSYEEKLDDIIAEEFAKMLVLDGCFILELLIRYAQRERIPYIGSDLFCIENQIPFSVLQELFTVSNVEFPEDGRPKTLEDLAVYYISGGEIKESPPQGDTQFHHLLHFFHWFHSKGYRPQGTSSRCSHCWAKCMDGLLLGICAFLYVLLYTLPGLLLSWLGCLRCRNRTRRTTKAPCAKELRNGWVRFDKKSHGSCFSASLQNQVLKIHSWTISKQTRSLFWNYIAMESNRVVEGNDAFNFVMLLSYLACTPDDVAILEDAGVIGNHLGSSKELLVFLRSVRGGALPDTKSPPFKDLDAYCSSKLQRMRAQVIEDIQKSVPAFFNDNPWGYVSFSIASVYLLLTSTAAICTIRNYLSSRN